MKLWLQAMQGIGVRPLEGTSSANAIDHLALEVVGVVGDVEAHAEPLGDPSCVIRVLEGAAPRVRSRESRIVTPIASTPVSCDHRRRDRRVDAAGHGDHDAFDRGSAARRRLRRRSSPSRSRHLARRPRYEPGDAARPRDRCPPSLDAKWPTEKRRLAARLLRRPTHRDQHLRDGSIEPEWQAAPADTATPSRSSAWTSTSPATPSNAAFSVFEQHHAPGPRSSRSPLDLRRRGPARADRAADA